MNETAQITETALAALRAMAKVNYPLTIQDLQQRTGRRLTYPIMCRLRDRRFAMCFTSGWMITDNGREFVEGARRAGAR